MAAFWEFISRFFAFFRKSRLDHELEEELRSHLEMMAEEGVRSGLSPEAASHAARLNFGGVEQIKDVYRDQRGLPMIETLCQDLRHGLRMLGSNPGFSSVVVLSLALGIGANTAIFQLVDALALKSLPVKNPQELVQIRIPEPHGRTGSFSSPHSDITYAQWEQLGASQQVFSGIAAWSSIKMNLSEGGERRQAQGLLVSGDYFNVLGVRPIIGRVFDIQDDQKGCGSSGAVLSYAFWQREFGGAASAIGKSLTLNGQVLQVVGVTPASFYGVEVGRGFDVVVPLCSETVLNPTLDRLNDRRDWWLAAIGRLKPGMRLEQANSQLNSISPGLFKETVPATYTPEAARHYLGFKLGAISAAAGVSTLRETYKSPLWVLMAITGFVLLIACANIANLMLARATAREREIAIRLSLGASRGRVVRQLLSEGLPLAAIGGAAGALIGGGLSRVLISFLSTQSDDVYLDLGLDWRVLTFTIGLSVFTCLLFGLAPAIRAACGGPGAVMKSGGRGLTASRANSVLRNALVVSQVALSLVLLIGALLFLRTLRNLSSQDAGFDQSGLLVASLDFHRLGIPAERRLDFKKGVLERMRAIPGVVSAAEADIIPLSGNGRNDNVLIGDEKGACAANCPMSDVNQVTEGYFKTLGTPILVGRDFDSQDSLTSPRVAIVNKQFVRQYFHADNALGNKFRLEVGPAEPFPEYQIIGVVKNSKYMDLREEFPPTIYLPQSQVKEQEPSPDYLVRTNTSLSSIVSSLKGAMTDISPNVIFRVQRFDSMVNDSLLTERLMATLSGFFGILAALLASIGLYGIMSYMVAQRRNEIGIRVALGADRTRVVSLVFRRASVLLMAGISTGAVMAIGMTRWTRALLFGLSPNDLLTFVISILALSIVGLTAGFIPARRASKMEPMAALRSD